MVKPQWHDRLRHELNKRGLPATYSARLVEELTDHFADIQQENLSMDADAPENKIGSPECLAAVAEEEFRRQTFAGRHPFVAFVVAPIPVAILSVGVIAFIGEACGRFIIPERIQSLTTLEWISLVMEMSVVHLSPVMLAWLFIRLSSRVGRPAWGLVACGLMAFVAFNLGPHIGPGFDGKHDLTLIVGLGNFVVHWQDRLMQAALPMMLGLSTWWRMAYPAKNSPWRHNLVPSSAPTHA